MPTVGIKKRLLDTHLNRVYSQSEFEQLCFDYGLELDEVTSEKASAQRERSVAANEALDEEELYKIELPANRYDLLSVEGLARALNIFLEKQAAPKYTLANVKEPLRLIVKKETKSVRPFVVGAVLRGVTLDADSYASFIDLQDKLHQNICRKRTLVSVGTHDLDTIKGPFEYRAEKPSTIRFQPLAQTKVYSAEELMTLYSNESHLKPYLPIIQDKPLYPVFYDSQGVVMSLPPIINGEHSKIRLSTKNILIEITATDEYKAGVVLDTIVTLFSQYSSKPFVIEPVEVHYEETGKTKVWPELRYMTMKVKAPNVNGLIGCQLSAAEQARLLKRMGHEARALDDDTIEVTVGPTRHDILHECDIAEDVGMAYGFNKLIQRMPEAATVGGPQPLNHLSDLLRAGVIAAGWTEALGFALCSRDDVSARLRRADDGLANAVHIANPKTIEFQVARNTLLPGLLKTLSANRDQPLPLKIFELGDVVLKDPATETGARNERRLCALLHNKSAGFELIQGLFDRVMQLLDVKPALTAGPSNGYSIRPVNNPTFLDGRCAAAIGPNGETLGYLGVLHPEVVTTFGLNLPTAALEITIEPFL